MEHEEQLHLGFVKVREYRLECRNLKGELGGSFMSQESGRNPKKVLSSIMPRSLTGCRRGK